MTGTTFTLHRSVDVSNKSGTGVVAEGWESSSGEYVVLVWLTATPSICIYRDIRHVEEIHGHEGASVIVWDTPTQYTPSIPPPDEPTDPPWSWDRPDDHPLKTYDEEDR
jgi:hypothetical protein